MRLLVLAGLLALLGMSPAAQAEPAERCVTSVVVARIVKSTYLYTPEPEAEDAIPWNSWMLWTIEAQVLVAGTAPPRQLEVYEFRHADYNPNVARHILMVLTRGNDGKTYVRHTQIVKRHGKTFTAGGVPVRQMADSFIRAAGLRFCAG